MQKTTLAILVSGLVLGVAAAMAYASPAIVASDQVIEREASEGPRGADNNNQRRRGRGHLTEQFDQIAREATEAPRGSDNNNQRRRGRG